MWSNMDSGGIPRYNVVTAVLS